MGGFKLHYVLFLFFNFLLCKEAIKFDLSVSKHGVDEEKVTLDCEVTAYAQAFRGGSISTWTRGVKRKACGPKLASRSLCSGPPNHRANC